MDRNKLMLLLKQHHQEHLLSYYDKLSQDDKDNLAAQIERIDWRLIDIIHQENRRQKTACTNPLKE
jgi:UDP-N-acetylglucosamine/UDP-N-acetylgalactosamine diphosphorylase